MEIVKTYLSFRIRQFWRFLQSIGIGYVILLLVLLSGILFKSLSNILALHDYGIYAGVGLLLSILFAQRNDTRFLRSTDMKLTYVFIADALLIGIPIILILLMASRFNAILGVLGLCIMIPIVWVRFATPFKISNALYLNDLDLPFLLSNRDFELKHLLRRFGVVFGLLYLTALITVMHPASLMLLTFLWMALLQTVYEYYEPEELILENDAPSLFLRKKLFRIFKKVQIMLIPFYLFGIYFSPHLWYLYILVFISVSVMLSFLVFNKYAFYRPRIERVSTSTISSIMLLFLVIPGFQLVVFLMSIKQYFKAKKNLTLYQFHVHA